MALDKQNININFSQGIDQKTDPLQVPLGKFLDLENGVFDKAGRLTKRNGYGPLAVLPDTSSTFLTTFNSNLTALGSSFFAYSEGTQTWVDKGPLRSMDLRVLPLVRSSLNQIQGDSAIADNGWICTAYTENVPTAGVNTAAYKYVIADSTTGQNIIPPTTLTDGSGSAKVFILGRYFLIVYTATVAAVPTLKFLAINSQTGAQVQYGDISTSYTPSSTCAFDAVVTSNNLFVAWNGSDGGGAVRITKLDSALTVFTPKVFAGRVATIMSVCADTATPTPTIYASFFNSGSGTAYTCAVSSNLAQTLAPTQIGTGVAWANLTSLASSGVCTIYYETTNTYSASGLPTNYIKYKTITAAGTVGTATAVVRSVGLASKLFTYNDEFYFLAAYQSAYQPTYFLCDGDGNVVSKLAYSNGGGYCTLGLPNVNLSGNVAQIPYLIKDLLQSVNKSQGAATPTGVYAQTGINLAKFTIGTSDLGAAEIGNDLHVTGGFIWAYDGTTPVEHGFHLWPDALYAAAGTSAGGMKSQQYYYAGVYEWTDSQGNVFRSAPSIPTGVLPGAGTPYTTTSVFSSGATSITVLSAAGFFVGQVITDTTTGANITTGTTITAINGNVITLSLPTAGNSAGSPGDTLRAVDVSKVTLEFPTLRLTYKISNPVRLVLYRWSTAQQTYYQVTSISAPILNSTTVDSVSYVDTKPDNQILGNNILYTTGGIVENIAAPAVCAMTLYKSRLVVLYSEDRNTLGYSKQVIQGTPAEMSDLFTVYVSPTVSAQGSTGDVTTLAALDDKLILFKENAAYYMTGNGPDSTGANNDFSEPVFITSTVGCTNQRSIVFIPSGLMFQSDKGIWLLGRDLSTKYIGAPVEGSTSSGLVQSAVNVPGTNQVRFTLDTGVTLMYDYYYDQWATFTNVPAISSTLYQGLHTYLDDLGRVFQETPSAYLDRSSPVLMGFTTSWLNLAGLQGFERAYEFYLLGTYISPHKLFLYISYDYNNSPEQLSIITPDNNPDKWGSQALWGSGAAWGGKEGSIEQWRVFLKKQKCQSFQITLKEVFDATQGETAGAGLTLSGIDLTVGTKKGRPILKASRQVG